MKARCASCKNEFESREYPAGGGVYCSHRCHEAHLKRKIEDLQADVTHLEAERERLRTIKNKSRDALALLASIIEINGGSE